MSYGKRFFSGVLVIDWPTLGSEAILQYCKLNSTLALFRLPGVEDIPQDEATDSETMFLCCLHEGQGDL